MQGQIGNVSREMEILRNNQKEMLDMKITITKIKNAFVGLMNRLDMAEERLSKLENISVETFKAEKQTEKNGWKKQTPEKDIQEPGYNYKHIHRM